MIKKYECVMQDGQKDCGVASLLTIVKTHGGSVPTEYLRVLTNTTKNGTNAYYLLHAAESLGFQTQALRGEVANLNKNLFPCIAHVLIDSKYYHFVVVHNRTKEEIVIADPAVGIRKMKITEFQKISTNQFLMFTPSKKLPDFQTGKEFLTFLCSRILQYKKILFTIFFFSLLFVAFNVITSYSFEFVIEDAIELKSWNNLYFIITFLVIFTLIKHITDFFRMNLFHYVDHHLDGILMKDIFRHVISLPYLYYKNRSTGDIISRVNDLSSIREALSTLFLYGLVDGTLIVLVFIQLARINFTLSLIALFISFFYFLMIKIFHYPLQQKILENKQRVAEVNSYLIESLTSATTIKGLNLERECNFYLEDIYNRYLEKSYGFQRFLNMENLFKNLIDGIGFAIILLVGSQMVLKEKMSVLNLITFHTLLAYFLNPIKNVIESDLHIKKMKVAIHRIMDLYSIKKESLEIDRKYQNKRLEGEIDIHNLMYSYNGRDYVLKNIDFHIHKGEHILICGDSGSGKSTLAKILTGFYEINDGMICVDGRDIRDHNLLELRRDVCYVSQNETLFTNTLYYNIVLNREISYDSFLNICKLTQVEKIAQKSIAKYDLLIEEGGYNISGGEKQKIILARSLLKDSSIYIFDESLSQIDIESERKILNKIFKLLKGKTVLVVSHRFHNRDLFDRTLCLRDGKVGELAFE